MLNCDPAYRDWLRHQASLHGEVLLIGSIDAEQVAMVIDDIGVYLSQHGMPGGPKGNEFDFLKLRITSPGGGIYESLGLYDYLLNLRMDKGIWIRTEVLGYAASAASMIVFQAGSERVAYKHSMICLHEPAQWGVEEIRKVSAVGDEYEQLRRLSDIVMGILSERSGRPTTELKSLIDRKEVWLSAEEALANKFIDKIL